MKNSNYIKKTGFTIVELIVVITAIGILAGIAIISYRGVQNRAQRSSFESTAQQAKLKLGEYMTDKNNYPASQADLRTYIQTAGNTELYTALTNPPYVYIATPVGCNNTTTQCTGYTITVAKSAWNGDAADTNIVVSP